MNKMDSFSRSILASLLITPVYMKPIDTIQDMLESESELRLPGNTAIQYLLKIDPRPDVQKLFKRHNPIIYETWTGEHEPWFRDRSINHF